MRFIHTADWQIGMRRHFLDADAGARFAAAREEAIRRIGQIAEQMGAEFIVVAGDVFEYNLLSARTVGRALDAIASLAVPVYLLPGNHDHWGPTTIYQSEEFRRRQPPNVHVLSTEEPVAVLPGVEVVGVPWTSKAMIEDRVAACLAKLPPAGGLRVMVAHGPTGQYGGSGDPGHIHLEAVAAAIADGRIHYLALGDRHSTTKVDASGRVWYAGAPEPTDYDEVDAGNIVLVDLTPGTVATRSILVGTWRFLAETLEVEEGQAAETVRRWLGGVSDKARTVVKLTLRGTIAMGDALAVDDVVEDARSVFAAIERPTHHDELAIQTHGDPEADLALTGYAQEAWQKLSAGASAEGPDGDRCRDALRLFYRLARGG